MIHRLDLGAAAAAAAAGDPVPSANAVRQVAWAAGSVVLLVVVVCRLPDHRVLARYGYLCGLAGLILLVLPGVLPASISQVNGAKLWIRVGPVSLQPGEFAKLLIIVFAAALLVQMRELFRTAGRRVARMELPRARDLAPLLAAWLLPGRNTQPRVGVSDRAGGWFGPSHDRNPAPPADPRPRPAGPPRRRTDPAPAPGPTPARGDPRPHPRLPRPS